MKLIEKNYSLFAFALLSACASQYASNGEGIYLQAKNGPELVVPSNLSSVNISHTYDCPEPTKEKNTVSVEPPVSYQS